MKLKKWAFLCLLFGFVFAGCDFLGDEDKNTGNANNSGNTGNTNQNSKVYLSEGIWTDDAISSEGQIKKYYITVTKGTRYFIYLNDKGDGDRTKTADVGLTISHSDSTVICSKYKNADNCYTSPFTFVASSAGTVTITAASYYNYDWERGTGTYAIKYTSRDDYYALSEGVWQDDKIIASGQTNKYSISVSKGERYFIWLNDSSAGDGLKTADIGLTISHSDGTIINGKYNNITNCWAAPYTFVVSSDGTVEIIAAAYYNYDWERGTGTYAIKYTSRDDCYALSESVWKNDDIIAYGQTNRYSIKAVAGTKYSIWLNDEYSGDGTKTAQKIGLRIIYSQDSNSNSPVVCNNYSNATGLYSEPYTFTAPSAGTIIITAASYYNYDWERGSGTYAIKYAKVN